MTDDEFIASVVEGCQRIPNAEAVNLGGSRARGDHRPDSDWDFAVYYRGAIDVSPFEALGWPGHVFRPFEWGQVMYAGAVFDVDGRHFDVHFRNLDVVDHWSKEASEGRFEIHILGFHLAGIPTYMLMGELAIRPSVGRSGEKCQGRPILRRSVNVHRGSGWSGPGASSTTRGFGSGPRIRSIAPARWPRRRCRWRMRDWRTAASGP